MHDADVVQLIRELAREADSVYASAPQSEGDPTVVFFSRQRTVALDDGASARETFTNELHFRDKEVIHVAESVIRRYEPDSDIDCEIGGRARTLKTYTITQPVDYFLKERSS